MYHHAGFRSRARACMRYIVLPSVVGKLYMEKQRPLNLDESYNANGDSSPVVSQENIPRVERRFEAGRH